MTDEFLDQQIARLSGTDYFGELTSAALREIRQALWTANSEAIAEIVVSEWLASSSERPTAHALREACTAENKRGKYFEPTWRTDPNAATFTRFKRKEVWELTAEELDRIPNHESGLPTGTKHRAEALDAWRVGRKAFEAWRAQNTERSK